MIFSPLLLFALAYSCWVLFLAVMSLYRARIEGTLTKAQKVLGYPLLWFGLVVDVLTNVIVGTLIFAAIPKEWLFTLRLIRHKKAGGWRGKVATWICQSLLDNLDPSGCHCKE